MACATCGKADKSVGYGHHGANHFPPMNATDIKIYDGLQTRALVEADWPTDRHKLLLFYPETFTPVCTSEMGAINEWVDSFSELNCDIYSVTTDMIEDVAKWYQTEPDLNGLKYKALSSFILPHRLHLMNGNRAKRASVIITSDGDMIVQEHFMKVGRSLEELHRTMYAYTTDSYCGEGWKSPADGFLKKKTDNDNNKT